MPIHSVYEFTCLCGRNFQTDDPHDLECPNCGRALVTEWRASGASCTVSTQLREVQS